MPLTYDFIAKRIDHSLLPPTLTEADLIAGCNLAADYQVASVCIKPFAVSLAKEILAGSGVLVGTTIGFPHGGHSTAVKVFESECAMADGAVELDMVVNIGQVLGGNWAAVKSEIGAITDLAHANGAIVKVIFENCYLTDPQKIKLCEICGDVNADYVKTSTGFGTGGATHADLILMRKASPPHVKIKAAGGVRDLAGAIAVAELGCERFGASKTAEILEELKAKLGMAAGVSRGAGPADSY